MQPAVRVALSENNYPRGDVSNNGECPVNTLTNTPVASAENTHLFLTVLPPRLGDGRRNGIYGAVTHALQSTKEVRWAQLSLTPRNVCQLGPEQIG